MLDYGVANGLGVITAVLLSRTIYASCPWLLRGRTCVVCFRTTLSYLESQNSNVHYNEFSRMHLHPLFGDRASVPKLTSSGHPMALLGLFSELLTNHPVTSMPMDAHVIAPYKDISLHFLKSTISPRTQEASLHCLWTSCDLVAHLLIMLTQRHSATVFFIS